MAAIYLVHEVHGAKVAISEEEAISDEYFGWERYNPNAPVEAPVNEMPVAKSRRKAQED
jgi:hypothetical protein